MTEMLPLQPSPGDLLQAVARIERVATFGASTRTITQNYVVQAQKAGKSSISVGLGKDDFTIPICYGKHGQYQDDGFCCDVCEASNEPSIPLRVKSRKQGNFGTVYVTDKWMQSIIAKQKGSV